MRQKNLLAALPALLLLAACDKELDQAAPAVAPTDAAASTKARPALLSQGSWHQTGLSVSTTAGQTPDAALAVTDASLLAQLKPHMLEQLVSYQPGGAYAASRGAAPGSDGPAAPTVGTWQLSAAADSLILHLPSHTRRFAVRELTDTTLRLAYAEAQAGGVAATYTAVYSR